MVLSSHWAGLQIWRVRKGGPLLPGPTLSLWCQLLEGDPWKVLGHSFLRMEKLHGPSEPLGEVRLLQPHVPSPSCLIGEHTSSSSGDTMSGPGTWPCTYHSHSWNCPGPAFAHARYCPLWPLIPTLCTASGPVQKPAFSSSFLESLGSLNKQLKPCLGTTLGHT